MRGLTAFALFAAAAPAFASDGRLEINQSCALVGCFAGDAAGFPVETAADQSYVLTSSLVVPDANTNGVALADRSTLDLNGFAIQGPTTCTGSPASCTGTGSGWGVYVSPNTTVRNGTIRGMGGYGIRGYEGTRIDGVLVESNGSGGIFSGNGSNGWSVSHCRVVRNGGIGISLNSGSPAASIIANSIIRQNQGDGIRASAFLIHDNQIYQNGGYGINAAFGGDVTTYRGNIITENNGANTNNQVAGAVDEGQNHCGSDGACP